MAQHISFVSSQLSCLHSLTFLPFYLRSLSIMFKKCLENFKGFLISQPPLVIFLMFLMSVTITLLYMALSIFLKDIRDPEVEVDWNVFLENFSKVVFCISSSGSSNSTFFQSLNISVDPKKSEVDVEKALETIRPSIDPNVPYFLTNPPNQTFYVPVEVTLHPTHQFLLNSKNITHFSGSVLGFQMGMQVGLEQARLDISFELKKERNWNTSICKPSKGFFKGKKCDDISFSSCVRLSGPSPLFPSVSTAPKSCKTPKNGPYVETHVVLKGHKELASAGLGAIAHCPTSSIMHTEFHLDPSLTVFLDSAAKVGIRRHLLQSAYFLLFVIASILIYAMAASHHHTSKDDGRGIYVAVHS